MVFSMSRNMESAPCKSESRRKSDIKKYMKNKWRQETFNNKLKVEKWEEKRQKAALRKYYKQLRKEHPEKVYVHPTDNRRKHQKHGAEVTGFSSAVTLTSQSTDRGPNNVTSKKHKPNAFTQALQTYEEKRQEKVAKVKLMEQQLAEKQEKLKQYKKQRTENFKKLSLKTARGQPVMAGRIHMLLNKIQQDFSSATD